MKKGKLKKILTSAALGVCACAMPFALTGCFGEDKDISVRVDGDYIQWQVEGEDDWTNLITLDEILNSIGDEIKGDKVEIQKTDTHIQWRYEGGEWQNLISLEEIKGDKCEDLVAEECTITYDFNFNNSVMSSCLKANDEYLNAFSLEGFEIVANDDLIATQKSKKGNFIQLYDFSDSAFDDVFLGWYTTDGVKFDNYRTIGGDLSLIARWENNFDSRIFNMKSLNSDLGIEYEIISDDNHTAKLIYGDGNIALPKISEIDGKFYKTIMIDLFNPTQTSTISWLGINPDYIQNFENVVNNITLFNCKLYFLGNEKTVGDGAEYWDSSYLIYEDNAKYAVYKIVDNKYAKLLLYEIDSTYAWTHRDYDMKYDLSSINYKEKQLEVLEIEDFSVKYDEELSSSMITYFSTHYFVFNANLLTINSVFNVDVENGVVDRHDIVILFEGNIDSWESMEKGDYLMIGKGHEVICVNYYSETQPTDTEHKYWHYDEDGKTPVIWELEN